MLPFERLSTQFGEVMLGGRSRACAACDLAFLVLAAVVDFLPRAAL
jgi:hypothetical protein